MEIVEYKFFYEFLMAMEWSKTIVMQLQPDA